MAEDREEGKSYEDDGTEGASVGYMTPHVEAEEKSSNLDEEPEEEAGTDEEDEEGGEGEEESKKEEEESGDEEGEDALKKVSPELEKERKELQADYTKKTQGIAKLRLKANLVDAIDKDPAAVIPALAERYGISLGGAAEPEKGAPAAAKEPYVPEKLVPKEGEELPSFIQRSIAEQFKAMPDMINEALAGITGKAPGAVEKGTPGKGKGLLDDLAVQNILGELDANHPDWKLYENEIVDIVSKHTSYINDIPGLYKAAKAQAVNVRDKVVAKKSGAKKKVRSGQRGSSKKRTSSRDVLRSFDESWDQAKADLKGR